MARTYLGSFSQGPITYRPTFTSREAFITALGSDASLGSFVAQNLKDIHFPRWHANGPDIGLRYRVTNANPTSDPTAITLVAGQFWLTQRFTKRLRYEQFGAIGDGTTSDHVAMGNCETVLNASTGNTLILTRPYLRTQNNVNGLSIRQSRTTVRGYGDARIIMDNVSGGNSAAGNGITQGHGVYVDVSLEDIHLDGVTVQWKTKTSSRTAGDGFRFYGYPSDTGQTITYAGVTKLWKTTKNITFHNCRALSCPQTGAIFMGCSDIDVRNFVAHDTWADQIHFNACRRIHADGIRITDSGDDGLALVNYMAPTIWAYNVEGEAPYTLPALGEWSNSQSHFKNITVVRTVGGVGNGVRVAGCKNLSIDGVYTTGRIAAVHVSSSVKTAFQRAGCTTTSGSAVITVPSAVGLVTGMLVRGTGIPTSTTILSISGTDVTLSANATATGTVTLTFGNDNNAWTCPASRGIQIGKVIAENATNGILALGEGTFTQAHIDALGISATLSDFTDFDVSVDDLAVENATGDVLRVHNVRGFRFGRTFGKNATAPGNFGLRLVNARDVSMANVDLTRFFVSINNDAQTEAQWAADYGADYNPANIRIDELVSDLSQAANAVEIQRVNGVTVDRMLIKNAANGCIYLNNMANLQLPDIEIRNPNTSGSASRRGVQVSLVRRSHIKYRIFRESQPLTAFEIGGGSSATLRCKDLVVVGEDVNTKNQTTHDSVSQTGSFAPTDCYIAKSTFNGGETTPIWRTFGFAAGARQNYPHVVLRGGVAYNPASITAGSSIVTTVSIPGAVIGDTVSVAHSQPPLGVLFDAWVSAADTVSVRLTNPTGNGDQDIADGFIRVYVSKHANSLAASF